VSVFLSGRPLWVNPELNLSDAFVAAWLPGSEGEGVADLLLAGRDGRPPFDFKGRLSFPWPATGMPVTYGSDDRVAGALFERGYGLSYAKGGEVGALPEDAKLAADRGGADTLFQSGHPTAPWSIFLADDLATVRMTDTQQLSPLGAMNLALAHGELAIRWTGSGRGIFWIGGRPVDLGPAAVEGQVLQVRLRVDVPPSHPVHAGLRCAQGSQAAENGCGRGAGMLDITSLLQGMAPGTPTTLSIPLGCFAGGRGLLSVAGPLEITTDGALGLTLSDVRFAKTHHAGCHPAVMAEK
jgi:beta-glucosidase